MKINVVGVGYIGLPTALMFAVAGMKVVGTDCNEEYISKLKTKKIVFKEEHMEELYVKALHKGINFSTKCIKANYYIISVPTPYIKLSKKLDIRYVVSAIKNVLDICEKNATIIVESTISPGTIDKHIKPIAQERGFQIGKDIHFAHAPERILPGNMIYELQNNARILGVESEKIGEKLKELYSRFCKSEIIITDIRTAEMTKVVENAFRDTNIAFANELTILCDKLGLDVYKVIQLANMHPRVDILAPGPGVGGHCIPVDPYFLIEAYPGTVRLMREARLVNEKMPEFVIEKIFYIMQKHRIKDTNRIGFYGLSYKENVDDVRESPTLQVLDNLKRHLVSNIKVYDPYVLNEVVENQFFDLNAFFSEVDVIIIMTAHTELLKQKNKLENKIVLDTRNCLENSNEINCVLYKLTTIV